MDLDALLFFCSPGSDLFWRLFFLHFYVIFTEPYYCVYCIVLTAKHPLNTGEDMLNCF